MVRTAKYVGKSKQKMVFKAVIIIVTNDGYDNHFYR